MALTEFKVEGIHCPSCIALIKMGLSDLKGVEEVKGNEKQKTVQVKFDEKKTNEKEISKIIEQEGEYTVVKAVRK